VLPRLFGAVAIPATVAGELRDPDAPVAARAWAASPPSWVTIHDDPAEPALPRRLDAGERATIALAMALGAGLLLVDDRAGASVARGQGFRVTGTIGVLVDAARQAMPCHHSLKECLTACLERTGIGEDGQGAAVPHRRPRDGAADAHAPAAGQRLRHGRAAAAGVVTKVGNHGFRATGITAYPRNGGTLEKAAAMANHTSTRTTQLYDRRHDEMSLDEVERIKI